MARSRAGIRIGVVALLATATVAGTAMGVGAFNPMPEPPARWVVGLTQEQTASLSVVNLAERGACEVAYRWLGADGEVLSRSVATVQAGTFDSHEFHPPEPVEPLSDHGDGDGDARPRRFQVRPAVVPLNPGVSCDLATTLEVLDNADGRTTVLIGNAGR